MKLRKLLNDIERLSTRMNRASNLKRHLVTDLEIIEKRVKGAKAELKNIDVIGDVSEIQNKAKKELLNAYYVAIHDRNMSVEDIMQSIEADRQFLDGEMIIGEVNSILNGR